jgi:hypothetical protein
VRANMGMTMTLMSSGKQGFSLYDSTGDVHTDSETFKYGRQGSVYTSLITAAVRGMGWEVLKGKKQFFWYIKLSRADLPV